MSPDELEEQIFDSLSKRLVAESASRYAVLEGDAYATYLRWALPQYHYRHVVVDGVVVIEVLTPHGLVKLIGN